MTDEELKTKAEKAITKTLFLYQAILNEEIKDLSDEDQEKFALYFSAGIGAKSALKDYDPDVSAFDEIVIGSPIWNGQLACPVNTVLDQTDLSGKKVTFLLYSGSGAAPKAESKLKASFPDAPVIHLTSPLSHPEELEKLSAL